MPLPEIPEADLAKATPIVDALRASIRTLTSDLPFDTDSSLLFSPESEASK